MAIKGIALMVWATLVSCLAVLTHYPPSPRMLHLIDGRFPSVFLELDPVSRQLPSDADTMIWLRLHNNTEWTVFLYADAELSSADPGLLPDGSPATYLRNGATVKPCYDIEGEPFLVSELHHNRGVLYVPQRPPSPKRNTLLSCMWGIRIHRGMRLLALKSGNSVVFSIPGVDLVEGYRVSTMFSYEWETKDGYVSPKEPTHIVFFSAAGLESAKE
jgi:hypothetical protein